MKIIFEQAELAQALDIVYKAAQPKVTSNTNNGILFTTKENAVEIQANDYTLAIKTICPAQIEEEGAVVIAAPQLTGMIKLMPKGSIVFEKNNEQGLATFTGGKTVYRFPIRQTDEYPAVTPLESANSCVIESKILTDLINLTQFATAGDKEKPLFSGILFEMKDSVITLAATNTHQLATKEATLTVPAENSGRLIVPSFVASEVIRLLSLSQEETVKIIWGKQHIAFSFGNIYVLSSLISGEYPDYKRVIPTNFTNLAEINLADIRAAVSMVTPISRDINYKTINFQFENNEVAIYEEDKSIGSSKTVLPCRFEGEPLHIVFNCFYIEDILKHSKGENVIFHLIKNGPMLVEQEEDKNYRYVVTPMRGR